MSKIMVKCAFCHGTGVDPFGIMSELSNCYVCGGKGVVEIEEPVETCSHCGGSGAEPESALPCLVCKGKGPITGKLVTIP